MATKRRPAPSRARFQQTENEAPQKKRRKTGRVQPMLEVVAPQATLFGLPDNILLSVMGLLDVHSLVSLSRVCRRFHHLHGDEFIWSDVDLTDASIRARLDARKLKKIIHTYLPSSMWRIKLSSNAQSPSLPKNPIVTESLLNDLFTQCPTIKAIVLHRCDLTVFSSDCKLFRCSTLESVSLTKCDVSLQWMETVKPSWPNLKSLSLYDTVKTTDYDLNYIGGCKDWTISLKSLILCGCYRVTNKGVQAADKGLQNLKVLDVTNCPQVSLETLNLTTGVHAITPSLST